MRYRSLAHVLLENSKLGETRGIHYFQNEKNAKFTSYNELFHTARRILNYLAGKGIKEGQELVLQIDDISSFVEVFWACILGKIIPVPVTASINDEIRLKLLNIWGILNDPWMCISKGLLDNLRTYSKNGDHAEIYDQIEQSSILVDTIHDSITEAEIKEPSGGDIAFIQFSSGSTGDPKGVVMSHRNLLVNVEDIVAGCRAGKEEVSVSWMPLTHDMGLIGCHIVCVFSGWNHCLINPTAFVRNPLIWLEKIQEYKATMTASPNFGFRHLLKSFKPERHKDLDVSSVRLIFNGAEPISAALCNEFQDVFEGFGLRRNAIFAVYGLAEAGLAVSFPVPGEPITAYTIDRNNMEIGKKIVFLDPQENGASFVSEGKPLHHCRIQITDNDNKPLEDDVCGNICIKGGNVTSGYYNSETETRKTIDAQGWLHTGDIGFIHDGSLVVTGRAKEIIFVNGQNYFPHDLERIIHEMDVIQEGKLAVTSINTENNPTGEVLCFIVHKKGLEDFSELTSSINQHVLSKSGVAIQRFIPVDKIPKTSSGKIQRVQLSDAYRRGEYNSILRQISGIAEKKKPGVDGMAGNEIERMIIQIVRDVLKIKDDEIGIDDNFFDMGITSLSLIQIKSNIENELNRKLDEVTLFEHSTIRKLAAHIARADTDETKPVAVIRPGREAGTGTEIAVIGMSCKFPGANSIDRFWENLKNGVESISFFSNEELIEAGCSLREIMGNNYVKAKGIIDPDRYFDSHFFEYTPRETEIIDPQMLVFLQCAWEALEDGSVNPEWYEGRVGVFSGGSPNLEWQNQVLKTGKNAISEKFKLFQLINKDFMSAWVSYKYNLKGPSVNIYTACSTSLVAVGMAASSLLHNECDIALAGGVSIHLPEISGYEYQDGMVLSKDGHVRTFDREASGTVFSDGAGVVALKRLRDAVRDKNHIYAVLLGADTNNDGNDKVAFTAPGKQGQAEVIRNTIARAGVEPSTISYIENHGASTLLGDPIEIDALKSVFASTGGKYCGLGSVKTNIGHLDVAAGIAGFIKTVLMLKHRQIPPSLNFTSLNPKIELDDTPFYIVDKLIDWKTSGFPLRAGVSSFGIGGTNAHVILQESPPMPPATKDRDGALICLSAKTGTALDEYIRKLSSYVRAHPDIDCGDLAYTLNKGRKAFSKRAIVILKKQESLKAALSEQGRIAYGNFLENETRQIIFVFHGLDFRSIGVGLQLYEKVEYFRREIESCSEKIKSLLGMDILSIFSRNTDTALGKGVDEIGISLLAMFIFEYALARSLIRWGIKPSAMIGYNIGEYAAACIAGSIDFESAVKIISRAVALERKHLSPGSGLKEYLDHFVFHDPKIPCYSHSLGEWIDHDKIKGYVHRIDLKNECTDFAHCLSFFHGKEHRIFLGIGPRNELAAVGDLNGGPDAGSVAFGLLPNQGDDGGEFLFFLESIGRIWLAGVDIDWRAFYEGREKNYLSLPGYAFEPVVRPTGFITNTKQPEIQKNGETGERSAGERSHLHPLLHQNTSDLDEHRYTTAFTGEEFFLKDHVMQGMHLLPAMACAEMARAAVEKSGPLKYKTIRFENLEWAQPFIFSEETKELTISLHREGNDGIAFKIYGNGTSRKKEKIYSQGKAITEDARQSDERLDLSDIIEECTKKKMTGKECYQAFTELGVSYGAGYRTIRDLYIGVNQVVAKLEKNGTSAEDNDGFILHPGMMDGALQAVIGFLQDEDITDPGLPFALERMDVYSGCTDRMWSVVRHSEGYTAENKIQKYDIDICDEAGVVCVKLQGFSTRVLDGDVLHTYKANLSQERAATSSETDVRDLSGELSLAPVWNPVQANAIERWPRTDNKIAVIGGTPEQKMALKSLYPEMKILGIQSTNTIDDIANKVKEIGVLDHLFWFGPVNGRILSKEEKSIRDLKIVQSQEKGVIQVFRLVKALLISGYGKKPLGLTIVTIQTQAIHNKEEIDPTHAGIHGLIGSLAKEYPNWRIRLVDVPSGDACPMKELVTLPSEKHGNAMTYRKGQWYAREFVSIRDIGAGKDLYKVNGVYVVIGGAGDVGRVWSKWMIEKYRAKIIWLGRKAENDDIRGKMDELGRFGPAPVYISADASHLDSLQKAYEGIKDTYPEINGIIHSALVLKYRSLSKMDEKMFLSGLEAKVNVSVNLSIVFEDEPLDFVLFFSSMQSFIKSMWQSNYAAGCTFKDAYGGWLNQKITCPVKVMNWGYWGSEGTVSAKEYRDQIAQLGLGFIEPDEGMPILDKFLGSSLQQMVFVTTTRPMAIEGITDREYISVYKENIPVPTHGLQDQLPSQKAGREIIEKLAGIIAGSMDAMLYRLLLCQLRSLGMFSGNASSMEDITGLTGMPSFYKLWLRESIHLLTEKNYLKKNDDAYVAAKSEDITTIWEEWERRKHKWNKAANNTAQSTLVEKCLKALPDVLNGRVAATDILFPNSSMELVEGICNGNEISHYYNEALTDGVVRIIQEMIKGESKKGIRIIEIGAGTGSTSLSLFSKLRMYEKHIKEYCYTDISKAFLLHAEEKYKDLAPYLNLHMFNVELPLREQKIESGGYDLAIAANVLHATKNIRKTLRNAKAVLKKGGMLFLNEISERSLFAHLTFGLLEGWWLSEDRQLRIPGSPGLYPACWKKVLEEEGFSEVLFPGEESNNLGQQIIAAVSDGVVRQAFGKAEDGKKNSKETRRLIRRDIKTPYVAPRSSLEKDLVRLWEDLFGYDRIGINDNFFEIGGDSLMVTILLNKIHEHFNLEIPIDHFFNRPTINELANIFDKVKKEEFSNIQPVGRKDFYPTSPAQKRIYLAQNVDKKTTSYNITSVWHLEGAVDMAMLSEAVKNLVARHDSLRTSFEILNGDIIQRISDSVMFEIEYIVTSMENLKAEIDSRVIPFDLSRAPLLRVTMMKISEHDHIIVADMHHSIADATSGGLMIREVMQMYSGKALEPLRIQYKDYTQWLSQRMASDDMKKQYGYWLDRMKNGIPTLDLVTDYERPAKQTFTGDTVETILDSEIANAVSEICIKHNATMYMIYYAFVSVLLSKYTGQTDILMGSPVSGRDHADLENVVGMFVNMLLMRSFPSPDKTFLQFLAEVRNDTLQGFKNKECQFDELSTKLHYQRDVRRNAIYDVVFAVMNMNIPDLAIPGVRVRPYEGFKDKTCKTDLRFGIVEKEKKISVNVTYNVDLFKKESIVKMSGHLVEIIKTVIKDMHVKLMDIKLLSVPVAAKYGKERLSDVDFDL